MALLRLNSIFDTDALEQEYAKYKNILGNSEKLLVSLFDATKQVKGSSLGNFTKAVDNLAVAMRESSAVSKDSVIANKNLVASAKEIVVSKANETEVTTQNTDANKKANDTSRETVKLAKDVLQSNVQVGATYKDASGSLEANLELQLRYKATLSDLQKELKNLQKENALTSESSAKFLQEEKKIVESIEIIKTSNPTVQANNQPLLESLEQELAILRQVEEERVKAASSSDPLIKKQVEIASSIEQIKGASTELQRTIRLQVKEQNSATESLDQLKAQYDRLFQVFRGLSKEDKGSSFGKQLSKDLGALSEEINKVQIKAGNFSGNVGRYAESLSKPFSTLKNKLDEIKANLAKGVAIGGSTDAAALAKTQQVITAISTELDKAQKEGAGATQQMNALGDAFTITLSALKDDKTNTSFIEGLGQEIAVAKNELSQVDEEAKRLTTTTQSYAGSFSHAFEVLTSELDQVRNKLATTGKDTPGFKKLEQEEKLLAKLTSDLSKSFKSPTQELRAFQNAAKSLGQEFGMTNTNFQKFIKEVGGKKDEIDDIQSAIKFQSSDTKYIDGLIGAVNGIAGAYGVAESATVLFGNENEDLQKSMQKLQAILTLVNSLQAVMNSLQTEGAAVQTVLAAKTWLLNSAKEIELLLSRKTLTAQQLSTASQIENLVATEAGVTATQANVAAHALNVQGLKANLAATTLNTTATEGLTVAEEGAKVATMSLRATLIASGIGILILGVVAAVAYLVTNIKDWDESIKENAKNIKSWADAIVKQNEIIQDQINILEKAKVASRDKLKAELADADALGQSQGKSLAMQAAIADKNKELAQDAIKAHGGYEQIIKDINDQEAALSGLNATQKAAQDEVVRLQKLKSKGSKTVDTQETREKVIVNREGEMIKTGRTEVVTIKLDIDDVIKKNETIVKDTDEAVASAKSALEGLRAVDKGNTDATAEQNAIRLSIAKLDAEERRKLILETARIEAEDIIDTNSRILNDEKSTQKQRLDAIESTTVQRRKIINAEFADIQNDTTNRDDDKTIAVKKEKEQEVILERETADQIRNINETYLRRRLAAELEVIKIKLDYEKSVEESLANDPGLSINDRLQSVKKFSDAQGKIIEAEYEHEKYIRGLNDAEHVAADKTLQDELLLLDADFNAKRVASAADTQEKVVNVLKSSISEQVARYGEAEQEIKTIIDGIDLVGTQKYSGEVQALNKSLQERGISYEKYHREREKLDKDYAFSSLENVRKSLSLQLALFTDNTAEIKETEADLFNQKNLLHVAETDAQRRELLGYIHLLEQKLAAEKNYQAKRSDLLKQQAENEAKISDATTENNKTKFQKFLSELETDIPRIGEKINEVMGAIGDIFKVIADRQLQNLATLEKSQQDNYDKEVARVNRSGDSEEEKSEKLKILEAQRQQQKEANAARQLSIEQRRARFEKAQNIASIIGSVALAVVKALQIPGPVGIANSILVGALGAAQLAVAIAQPIPKYKTGRGIGKEELAITGDGGVSEYIVREGGKIEKTPAVETLVYLNKKDRVLPNKDALMRELAFGAVAVQPVRSSMQSYSGVSATDMMYINQRMANQIVGAVENIHISTTQITKGGWREMNQRLSETEAWVNKKIRGL